ncbi:UNVERIFIED_ORG: hypothetical protein E4P37_07890 [Bacillus sp. AZ43]
MDASAIVAVVAAGISLAALAAAIYQAKSARDQVTEARAQTDLQRQMHRDAAQPYVWADVRPDDGHGQLLRVIVENGGPTVARDVRISFNPPLPEVHRRDRTQFMGLENGISALTPGRRIMWTLGVSFELMSPGLAGAHEVTVDAVGPFGPLEQLRYTIDLSQWRESAAQPPGTLHEVRNAIVDVAKALKK